MKTGKKRRAAVALLFTLLFMVLQAVPAAAANIPKPTDAFYVNDFSDLLLYDTKEYIVGTNEELYEKTGAQIVVVTVDSLEGTSIEEYSTELFRSYGIGDAKKNNGVLLLVAKNDREVRIEVGYGMEGAINDAKAGRILDQYVIPYLADEKWNIGIKNGYAEILKEVCREYGVEITRTEPIIPVDYETASAKADRDMWMVVVVLVAGLIAGLIIGSAATPGKAWIPGVIWVIASFVFLLNQVSGGWAAGGLFGTAVATMLGWAITSPGDGSSYSSSSYSSSSYSSSGRSSGGSSYGSHSGGGGRSGGGGASRKF
ncbi:MAG: TPM domain-containing protein [Lachnospiraceae bacterium]|nr:TPM domain-containing protein [Lachnospiraceae bacterium]